ncbi:Maf-like protein [Gemmatimonadetes bacterium T265]|nr:Maf-like protein [Gemmatimonadetes bacterium T265]
MSGAGDGVPVVLASQSPRRRDLLTLVGIPHTVRPADVDETVRPGEAPAPYVERLAREKARAVAAASGDAVVVAADTTVVVDGEILGKPRDAAEARAMVARLAGRTHEVFTGMAVRRGGPGAREAAAVERVRVTFRPLGAAEVAAYVATGEPMDKAGAYGIQGYGATIVERIEGDYFAVMGLSLVRLVGLLGEVGVRYEFGAGVTMGGR